MQENRVNSWFLVVRSQSANLTPDLFFGHNLCFRCPNGWCEPILDIYISISFQWYKELFKALGFDPCNRFLNIRESNSQSGSSFGSVRVHSLTLSFTPTLPSWLATLQALALVVSPRLQLQHQWPMTSNNNMMQTSLPSPGRGLARSKQQQSTVD
jgi:hypothetical protein